MRRKCDTPTKVGYRTRAEAEAAAVREARVRVYRCPCRLFHLYAAVRRSESL